LSSDGGLPSTGTSGWSPSPSRRGSEVSSPRVGVVGLVERVVDLRVLHALAGVHHRHVVGHAGHHAEVVGDHDHGDAEFALALSMSTSRIWACTVTSRAVVGSSAISSFGVR
jgi:uncharacterized protein YcsI (UPF0317 family)